MTKTISIDDLTQDQALALADAGYMPVREYVDLCRRKGWARHARSALKGA